MEFERLLKVGEAEFAITSSDLKGTIGMQKIWVSDIALRLLGKNKQVISLHNKMETHDTHIRAVHTGKAVYVEDQRGNPYTFRHPSRSTLVLGSCNEKEFADCPVYSLGGGEKKVGEETGEFLELSPFSFWKIELPDSEKTSARKIFKDVASIEVIFTGSFLPRKS